MKPRRFFLFAVLFLTIFALGNSSAYAAKFVSNDQVNLTRNIHDDVYIAAGDITIDGDIDGNLVVVGGNVVANGDINGDLFVVGGNVAVNGNVNHTAWVTGWLITLNGDIERDLFFGGGTVSLTKKSVVSGDVVAAGGNFISRARIQDDLIGAFGNATIDGPVGGDVKIAVDKLTVAKQGNIGGDLNYTSSKKAKISPRANIAGETTRRRPPKSSSGLTGANRTLLRVLLWLWSLASMLVIGIVLSWLFPGSLRSVEATLAERTWPSLGIGFAALFLTPIAVLIVMFTIIGVPLALIVLILYVIAIYISQIYAATAVGSMIVGKDRWVGLSAILGIILLSIVKVIPWIGGLIGFLAVLFGLGAMILSAWRYHAGKTKEQVAA
ncbi:MAG TPA: hypothetical protein ENI11_03765 [Actinobacteria bacterium]|nr:hypothetical protein [Actinomycetota bacterium]